jgi:hypothetical protein
LSVHHSIDKKCFNSSHNRSYHSGTTSPGIDLGIDKIGLDEGTLSPYMFNMESARGVNEVEDGGFHHGYWKNKYLR